MKSLFAFLFLNIVFIASAFAETWEEAITRRCYNHRGDDMNRFVEASDCEFAKEDGKPFLRCVAYISSEAPIMLSEETNFNGTSPDNETKPPDINLDYTFKISMQEVKRGSEGEVEVCLMILSVSFQRVWNVNKRKRRGFPMASRLFNVVANAEMISSDVELLEPLFAGRGIIDENCYDSVKENYSSCIIDVDISLTPVNPGSDDDVNEGVVDFDIHSYGYSHISPQSYQNDLDEIQFIPSFPDRTRRGKRMLWYLPGENITVLKLPKNRWPSLDVVDVKSYPKLEILDLSKNVFETFDTGTFKGSAFLKELNFSECRLKSIPPMISNQTDLRVLNVGGNSFAYDEDSGAQELVGFISDLVQIEKLNISGFKTKIFVRDTLPRLPQLKELDASRCEMELVDKNAFMNVLALEKIDLSRNSLSSLPFDLFFPLDHLKYVDLSFNKFTDGLGFLFSLSSNVELLDMSSNSMSSAEDLILYESKVKRINLANNVLRDLKNMRLNLYGKGALVEELDLSSNLIPALSKEACDTLSTLKLVNLTENQFNCDDCNLLDFQHWLNYSDRSIFTSPPEDFMCAAPPLARIRKIRVIDAEYNEECIGPDVTVVAGSTLSGIILLASLISGVVYIYRFEVSYILHLIKVKRRSGQEGKPHSECIYDAFVSYSGHDRDWVLRILQPELEEGEQKYQLCLHDRNFTLGGIITQNIVESIDKSRKTILILSKGFVDSQWCRWEMEMANHKLFNDSRDFLVLVELERLDRRNLPRHLRFLMDTRTYLEWPSPEKDIVAFRKSSDDRDVDVKSHSSQMVTAGIPEVDVNVFWKRFREALGDSLYTKEQKARQDAEIAIKKTKERDPGTFTVYRRTLEKPIAEEAM